MKKIILLCLNLVAITCLWTPFVSAQESVSYVTEDAKSPVSQIIVQQDHLYLIVNQQSDESPALMAAMGKVINDSTTRYINPTITPEEIQADQEKYGVNYQQIADRINIANSSVHMAISELQFASPGIFPLIDPSGSLIFMVSYPKLVDAGGTLKYQIFDTDVLVFEVTGENQFTYLGYTFNKQ